MRRVLRILIEQADDGSCEAWISTLPERRSRTNTLDLGLLSAAIAHDIDAWVAAGGDPKTLAQEDTCPSA